MKKTNKTFKRFAAITSASLLAACAMAPVFTSMTSYAAEAITEGSITITTPESDHAYRAYQIFDGDLSKETVDSVEKITFANIKWGSGVLEKITVDGTELSIYDALKNANSAFSKDVPNPAYVDEATTPDVPTTIKGALTSAEEVSKVLETINSNIPVVTTFAAIDEIAAVFEQFKDTSKTNIINSDYDSTNEKYVISIADPGYYLVEETKSGNALANGEAVTKYLLQVAGNAVVNPKADAPKVMKKVQEDSKTVEEQVVFNGVQRQIGVGYNDVADYSIGEDINFRLYGSLPTSFANYEGYYYKFTDTMGTGLSLVNKNATSELGEDDFTVKVTDGADSVVVDVSLYNFIKTNNGFEIVIPDLKKIDMDSSEEGIQTMTSSAIITVDYVAELNSDAVIGNDGNPNDVYLTYSNNSNTAQGGANEDGTTNDETGNTAKDYNVVFTYQLDITKYLGSESTTANATAGTMAGFKLFRDNNGTTEYAKFTLAEGVYKFVEWTTEANATQVETKEGGLINMVGLQDGTYKLTETLVPTGYNKMDDKTIVITANTSNANTGTCQNYNETSGTTVGNALTSLTISVDGATPAESIDANKSSVDMEITNNKGNELPGTGGIGTTIFYLGGGAMAAIGGIYLISKRRMRKSEE